MPGYGSSVAARHHEGGLSDASGSPQLLLEGVLGGQDLDGAISGLIERLGRPGYGIGDLFGDAARLKDKIAAASTPAEAIERWRLLDRLVGECLRRTTSSHETFIDNTL